MVGGIGAVMFNAKDNAGLARWYAEKLGFPTAESWGEDHFGTMHENVYYGFNQVDADPVTGAIVLYFSVKDCDSTFAEIKSKGAEVLDEPKDWDWGGRAAAFADPAGNKVWIFNMLGGGH